MKISIIIPTYGRNAEVLKETISSIWGLGDEFFSNVIEVFLIDQNRQYLLLKDFIESCSKVNYFIHSPFNLSDYGLSLSTNKINFIHIVGMAPSVTMAKNYAISLCSGELLLFFDDDILVQKDIISLHLKFQVKDEQMGILGGREIICPSEKGRPRWKDFLINIFEKAISDTSTENEYKIKGKFVGRIMENSFAFCSYDQSSSSLTKVDAVRGCNASLKRAIFNEVLGFDENFQGTALREETDLCLRIKRKGYNNYFLGSAVVKHMRQLGGCNNLSQSYLSLISKLDCEVIFQNKHFKRLNVIYFFIRLLPLAIEYFLKTWGISFVLLFQYTLTLYKRNKGDY